MEPIRLEDVAVVTVAYNASGFIAAMLDALPREALRSVIVVDNASEAPLIAALEPYGAAVTLVVPGANLGFGTGNNVGADAAGDAPWLLFLNPDAVLDRANLEQLLRYAEQHPEAAVVGPRVFDHGSPLTSAGDVATLRTELRHHGPPIVRRLLPERRHPPSRARSGPVGYVEGGCFLVDGELFRGVGGFDPRFFLYYEESDFARRVRLAGREVHLCADAAVEHHISTTRVSTVSQTQIALLRSASRYIEKWQGRAAARVFAALVALRVVVKAATGRLPRPQAKEMLRALFDLPAS